MKIWTISRNAADEDTQMIVGVVVEAVFSKRIFSLNKLKMSLQLWYMTTLHAFPSALHNRAVSLEIKIRMCSYTLDQLDKFRIAGLREKFVADMAKLPNCHLSDVITCSDFFDHYMKGNKIKTAIRRRRSGGKRSKKKKRQRGGMFGIYPLMYSLLFIGVAIASRFDIVRTGNVGEFAASLQSASTEMDGAKSEYFALIEEEEIDSKGYLGRNMNSLDACVSRAMIFQTVFNGGEELTKDHFDEMKQVMIDDLHLAENWSLGPVIRPMYSNMLTLGMHGIKSMALVGTLQDWANEIFIKEGGLHRNDTYISIVIGLKNNVIGIGHAVNLFLKADTIGDVDVCIVDLDRYYFGEGVFCSKNFFGSTAPPGIRVAPVNELVERFFPGMGNSAIYYKNENMPVTSPRTISIEDRNAKLIQVLWDTKVWFLKEAKQLNGTKFYTEGIRNAMDN